MLNLLEKTYYGNTIWQWALALVLIALSIIAGKLLYWFIGKVIKRFTAKTETQLDDIIVDMIEEPLVFIGVVYCIWLSLGTLQLPPVAQKWIANIFHGLVIINIAWLISRTVDALLEHYLVPLAAKSETDLDDVLLPIVRTTFRFAVWALAIIVAMNNAGYDVGAVLAGLGIGGLAIAMAAKETVSNMFGGATIMTTRPFTMGERIRVSGIDGWVIDIGLRTTTVRDFCGHHHIIPNKIFTDKIIENVDAEPSYFHRDMIHMRHDTSLEQMQAAMDILKDIVLTGDLFDNDYWITFEAVGEYSLDLEFWYGIKKLLPSEKPVYGTGYKKQSVDRNYLYLEIMKRFREQGLKFALPLQIRMPLPENAS